MTITRYILKNGETRWKARVNVRDKQAKKEGFRTREEAEDWYADRRRELLSARDAGTLYGPDITIGELAQRWLDFKSKRLAPSTIEDYNRQLDIRILPTFGKRTLKSITTLELQKFLDDIESPRTANKVRANLSNMFKVALAWGLILNDPTRGLEGRTEKKKEMRILTHEEAARILYNMRGQHRIIAYLALMTGMRIGEILALEYRDFKEHSILVNKSVRNGVVSLPKSGRIRRIRICPILYGLVSKIRQGLNYPPPSSPIFSKPDGRYLERYDFYGRFKRACKKAEVGGVRPHDLRHTYATWCLSAGINPKFVQEQLGHSKPSTTIDIYSHVMDNTRAGYEEWLEGQIGRISDEVQDITINDTKNGSAKIIKFPGQRRDWLIMGR